MELHREADEKHNPELLQLRPNNGRSKALTLIFTFALFKALSFDLAVAFRVEITHSSYTASTS